MIIDAHIHHYPIPYLDLLRRQPTPPMVVAREGNDHISMFSDTVGWEKTTGVKVLPEFNDYEAKIEYMNRNNIDAAIISLGNPWLDSISPGEAETIAHLINSELSDMSVKHSGRLWGFACLPTSDIEASTRELFRIKNMPGIVGIILGTRLGKGWLDEEATFPFWDLANQLRTPIFLHPHYAIGGSLLSTYNNSLRFSLGFPYETTFAASRLIMSGILDRFPDLNIMLAHGGGALTTFAGRIEAYNSPQIKEKLKYSFTEYLRFFYYDCITYSPTFLRLLSDLVGIEKIIFGTDYPFSAADTSQIKFIVSKAGFLSQEQQRIFSGNAQSLFHL